MKTHLIIALAALLLCSGLAAQTPASDDPDQQYATQLLKKGDKAPQIRLNDIDGKPFSLKSLKGRRVVLVFWASWCPDCRAEVIQLFDPSGKKDSAVGRDYHVKWIPSLYLIDAKGKVEFGTVVASKIANAL